MKLNFIIVHGEAACHDIKTNPCEQASPAYGRLSSKIKDQPLQRKSRIEKAQQQSYNSFRRVNSRRKGRGRTAAASRDQRKSTGRQRGTPVRKAVVKIIAALILLTAAVSLTFLAVSAIRWRVFITLKEENAVFTGNSPIIAVSAAAFGALVIFSGRFLEKIRPCILFAVCAAIWLVLGIYIVHSVDHVAKFDQEYIYEEVEHINAGNYTVLAQDRYLGEWPDQLGLLTLERLVSIAGYSHRAFMLINLVMIIVINFLLWRITAAASGYSAAAQNYTILLTHLFLPELLYLTFIYGTTPGLLFMLTGVLALLMFWEKGGAFRIAVSAVFFGLVVMAKKNYQVACIALIIVLFLEFINYKKWIPLLIAVTVMISSIGIHGEVISYYEHVSGYRLRGMPLIMNITMGLQGDPYQTEGRCCGWVDGYNEVEFKRAGYDPAAASAVGMRDFKERLSYFARNPVFARDFFTKKLISTWCDPTFQSVWSGPTQEWGAQPAKTEFLRSLYSGGKVYRTLELFGDLLIIFLYSVCAAGMYLQLFRLLKKAPGDTSAAEHMDRLNSLMLYFVLYYLGGFSFHMISETKSQYVYVYVLCLIPAAASVLCKAQQKLFCTA